MRHVQTTWLCWHPSPQHSSARASPWTEEPQEPRDTWASTPLPSKLQHHTTAHHLCLLIGASPVPCQTPLTHGHIHPPGTTLQTACTAQGKPASTCMPQGTPHAPRPRGCWCARYFHGQAGHLRRGSKGCLEPRDKQGSTLQRFQVLGIQDNCPVPGCGFAQKKTEQ